MACIEDVGDFEEIVPFSKQILIFTLSWMFEITVVQLKSSFLTSHIRDIDRDKEHYNF